MNASFKKETGDFKFPLTCKRGEKVTNDLAFLSTCPACFPFTLSTEVLFGFSSSRGL